MEGLEGVGVTTALGTRELNARPIESPTTLKAEAMDSEM